MKQYPHFLFYKTTTEATQNADGTWTQPSASWVLLSECRAEINGSGNVVNGSDGKAIVYQANVHLPIIATRLNTGDRIIVSETNSVSGATRVAESQVLRFDAGQLHFRIWV